MINGKQNTYFPNDFPQELLSLGHSLESIGISEFAWKSEDALNVINFLVSKGYAILGGDVYVCTDKGFESIYDSWYVNKSVSERFIEESRDKAFEYIMKYTEINGSNYLYSIVFELV